MDHAVRPAEPVSIEGAGHDQRNRRARLVGPEPVTGGAGIE